MKICVTGQGYIGLPTANLFADNGCEVLGVDVKEEIINSLNNCQIHIEEPGIKDLLINAIEKGLYRAALEPEKSDVFIITVPTPYIEKTYSCDLTYVIEACHNILKYLEKGNTVIVESTIAPLSIDNVIKPIFEKERFKVGEDIYLAHCPERVLPGKIIDELIHNDRIIGGVTPECSNKAAEIYSIFAKGDLMKTEAKTAELSKCMENTFRDVNIALANELTKVCSEIGVNALDVIRLSNKHPRVNIHSPGPGVGGHCLAIDPYFIYALAPETAKIIKLSRDTNKSMPKFVTDNVNKILKKNKEKIAVLGVSYKGNTDDTRESPAFEIINYLKNDYEIYIHDPHVKNDEYVNFEDAIKDASLCLILSDHNQFKTLDYEYMSENMEKPIIFDTKNIIENVPENIKLYNFGNLSTL